MNPAKERIHLLDEIRGIAVLGMILHHCLFGFCMFGLDLRLLRFDLLERVLETVWFEWLRLPFVLAFLVISGICCNFSKSNLKRGVVCFAVAMAVTLVTFLVGMPIKFGILHLLGVCMLLAGILEKAKIRLSFWSVFLFGVLFFLSYNLKDGSLGMPGLSFCLMPQTLYETKFLFWLGLPDPTFSSSDYFPLLPWIFPFFSGVLIGQKINRVGWPDETKKLHLPFFSFLGRHSLWIYLIHQPLFFGLFFLLDRFV